ncbi:MAG: hypothetical protein QM764_20710 [Chitinophagaceae bacterium]
MKKYLLGIVAIAVAVGLNAFTTEKKPEIKKMPQALVWFQTNSGKGSRNYAG